MWVLVLQRVFLEAMWDLVYAPLWWYTGGLAHALRWCVDLFKSGNETLAPGLWLRFIFVPMFGQYDWEGRVISFFMRLAQAIFRLVALFFWLIFCLLLFFVWLALPVVVMWGLVKTLSIT